MRDVATAHLSLSALLLASTSCQQTPPARPPPRPPAAHAEAALAPPAPEAPPTSLDPEGCRLRLANPPGDLDDRPGPAYVHVHGGLLRIAPSGTTLLPAFFVGVTRVTPGPRGEVWFADDEAVHVLEPTSFAPQRVGPGIPGKQPHEIVVGASSDLWGLWIEGQWATMRSWEVARHDGRDVVRRADSELGGPDATPSPDGIAWTSEGLWVSTSSGLWRVAKGDWQKMDAEPHGRLAASGDRLVRILGHGRGASIAVREAGAWRRLPWHPGDGVDVITIEAVSPSGLIVWRVRDDLWIGSLDGDCEAIALEAALEGRWPLYVAIDGRNRVWVSTEHGLLVVDRTGRVLADYLPWSLPGLAGPALGLAVPSAGPDVLPLPGPRRRMDVVGQLFANKYAPIAGATVRIRVGTLLERETITEPNGAFRLSDVPEGRYRVDVIPRPRTRGCDFDNTLSDFELRTATDCPVELVGEVCELGLRLPCRDGGRVP